MPDPPLIVPLEGVLLQTDLTAEVLARFAKLAPRELLLAPLTAMRGGRAALYRRAAAKVGLENLRQLLRKPVVEWVNAALDEGRPVFIVAAEARSAAQVLPEEWERCEILTPAEGVPDRGKGLADALARRFGPQGYDFIGGPHATHGALGAARKAYAAVRDDRPGHLRGAFRHANDLEVIATLQGTSWRDWLFELRLHQWAKNLLIMLPSLSGHHLSGIYQIGGLIASFLAMGLCASATYVWNDILDVESDRRHPRKRRRLLASGRTSLGRAFLASLVLLTAALTGGFLLNRAFGVVLLIYVLLTVSYSTFFKRVALIDLFLLTSLYLVRIVAGVVVGETLPSFWLFGFSFLFFLSLAAAKRQVELQRNPPAAGETVHGRGYLGSDLPLLSGLGIATAVASVMMLALYSDSEHVQLLYRRPEWLWGACVLCLFWVSRVWLLTIRCELHDDPVVFAIKDKFTVPLALLGLLIFFMAGPMTGPLSN